MYGGVTSPVSRKRRANYGSLVWQDFMCALQQVRTSVSQDELGMYEDWNKQFGSLAI